MSNVKIYRLYIITSQTSGKQYVGITGLSIHRRWKDHIDSAREGRKYAICGAIRKYGVEDFKIEEKEQTQDQDEISQLEKEYIQNLNTLIPNGYNMIEGGLYEVSWTEKMLANQSEMSTKNNLERYKDDSAREKSREIANEQWRNPVFRKKMKAGSTKRYEKSTEREKSSKIFKKLWKDSEFIEKQLIGRLKSLILDDTPIEEYQIRNRIIYVKREDLCAKPPLPPFSKARGVVEALIKLRKSGIEVFGYTESSISMAGIAIAAIAKRLNLKAVIYDPQYSAIHKKKPEHLSVLDFHRTKWKELGARVIPIKAGMVKVNYYICKRDLARRYPNSIMLPLGLPFQETIDETARIAAEYNGQFKTVVICIGSGTICAGIIKGMPRTSVYGIMSRTGNADNKRKTILTRARFIETGLLGKEIAFRCINPGWEYTTPSRAEPLYPTHDWYDLKAFQWLIENIDRLKSPILFWNIGALPENWNGNL